MNKQRAPRGATHYTPETEDFYFCWWKITKEGTFFICEADGVCDWKSSSGPYPRDLIAIQKLEPYPPNDKRNHIHD